MARRSVFVLATVHSVQETFGYPCCTKCHGRIRALEDENTFSCTKCHQEYKAEDVNYRYRVSIIASDTTQTTEITVFGSCLDQFFGCSATDFNSIVCCLLSDCENHGISISKLVHQAMEQCFIGSSLQFGFRVAPPCRTASQIGRGSPVQLVNIASNISIHGTRDCRHTYPNTFSRLTACQIARASQMDLSPTVLDILTETVRQIWSDSPNGHFSGLENHTPQRRVNLQGESVMPSSHGSLSKVSGAPHRARPMAPSPRMSGQYCTPKSLSQFLSPMVLTCDSNSSNQLPESGSTSDSFSPESPENIEISLSASTQEYLKPIDVSFQLPSPNKSENKKSPNPRSPHNTLYYGSHLTNLGVSESIAGDPSIEQVSEFPSSEDLSAFLADLVLDEFGHSSKEEFGLLIARNRARDTTSVCAIESKGGIAENGVCARLEVSRELRNKSRENSWLSVIPGVNTTWQLETNYSNTPTSSDIKHLPSGGSRGEWSCGAQSALIENTEAWQTNSIELPRCANISVSDTVDGESGYLGNTPLSVYSHTNASKSLNSLSNTSLEENLQIERSTGSMVCDFSDFPSSEDLEVFLANIESSYFPSEVRRSYLSNISTEFSDSKNLQRKTCTINEKLHDSSFVQSKPTLPPKVVNADTDQTDLGENNLLFWQSPGQTKSGSSASSEISFEIRNSWFIDDSPISNCNEEQLRYSERTSRSSGTERGSMNDLGSFNSRRAVERNSEVTLDDLRERTDECKCNTEPENSGKCDKTRSSGFKTQNPSGFIANTSELEPRDGICALTDPTGVIPMNEGSGQSFLCRGTPELFSQSRSLFDNSTSCWNTPLLFPHSSPEEFSSLPAVDEQCVASLLLFSGSQSIHEPCSPLHSMTSDTKSIKQRFLHHLNHSTPLEANRCTFGSTHVNRVLFSASCSSRCRTRVKCRSGTLAAGKFSCPESSASSTSSFGDELSRYPNTPLLFSISSSSVTESDSEVY